MPRTVVARALSTELSWRMLELLVAGSRTKKEIGSALAISDRAVSDHLEDLVDAGMVKGVQPVDGDQDTARFELVQKETSVGFPPRSYQLLSDALIGSLVTSLGEEGAQAVLKDMGLHIGSSLGESIFPAGGTEGKGPKDYESKVVEKFLKDMQTFPRVVASGPRSLTYETRNCLFHELAVKYPGLVCDVLDTAIHDSIDKKAGATSKRLQCVGHGDQVCRYKLTWDSSAGIAT